MIFILNVGFSVNLLGGIDPPMAVHALLLVRTSFVFGAGVILRKEKQMLANGHLFLPPSIC
jgi:hypothetical protein